MAVARQEMEFGIGDAASPGWVYPHTRELSFLFSMVSCELLLQNPLAKEFRRRVLSGKDLRWLICAFRLLEDRLHYRLSSL